MYNNYNRFKYGLWNKQRCIQFVKQIMLHVFNAVCVFPVLGVRNPAATDGDRNSGCYENDEHVYDYVDKV